MQTTGALVELLGAVLTGVGLWRTWRENAPGQKLAPAMWREFKELFVA